MDFKKEKRSTTVKALFKGEKIKVDRSYRQEHIDKKQKLRIKLKAKGVVVK